MTRTRDVIRRTASVALVLGLMTWIVRGIVVEANRHEWAALEPDWGRLVLACAVLAVAYLVRANLWTWMLRSMGTEVRLIDGWRIFMGSQLGRYLPGKVWQVAGAGVLARVFGVSGAAAAVAAMISVLVHHVVGGALALLVVSRLTDNVALTGALVMVVGLGGIGFLVSPLLPKSLRWLGKVTGRTALGEVMPPKAAVVLAVTPGYLLVWLGFAWTLNLVSGGLFPDLPTLPAIDAVGAMAAAAVIGFAVLIAPSGLGVREAVMVAFLTPIIGVMAAGVVAIAHRIAMTVTELVISLWGAWPYLRQRTRRTPSDSE